MHVHIPVTISGYCYTCPVLCASMNSSLYKEIVTLRGLKYHYYHSPAQDGKRTLLFCHGFPSTSKDWSRIALSFKEQGYGVIVPDMLGYGGTDKPADPALYVQSAMSQDIVCILDAENVEKAVAIGHDWCVRALRPVRSLMPSPLQGMCIRLTAG